MTGRPTAAVAPPPPAPHPSSAPIVVAGVSKWFKEVVALSDVTCTVGYGLTALLGPNGAGKSTLFRLLCGLTEPSKGTVHVLGGRPRVERGLTRQIGLVPQQEGVFEPYSALAFVRLAGVLHGLPDADAQARRALELVELDAEDRRALTAYSKGMRQRVRIAQALVHDPAVLFLDEPLNGLDPRQRVHVIGIVQRLAADGRCVVVSSHVLDEVERLGSRVLVIVKGRLAAEGDFHAIRDLMDDRPLRVRVRAGDARGLATDLLALDGVVGVEIVDAATAILETVDVGALRHAIAGLARARATRLFEVQPLDEDLESVFRYLVGR